MYDEDARIIEAIQKAGPRNVALLSRLTGLHPETVRYKLKTRFKKAGFKVHAEVDYDRLGLSLFWSSIEFRAGGTERALRVLQALSEVGHLVYYGRVVPQGTYKVLFAVPQGRGDVYNGILHRLKKDGVVRDYSLEQAIHWQNYSMNPRYFNFQSLKWEVDWSKVPREKPRAERPVAQGKTSTLDLLDLLIVKELQKDAQQHMVAIAKKLGVNSKTLMYHYDNHVEERKLVRGYEFRWMQDLAKNLAHSALWTNVVVKGLNKGEAAKVREEWSKVPFIWADYLMKNGDYSAWFCAPLVEISSTFDYLSAQVSELGAAMEVNVIKTHDASSFTVPFHAFRDGWSLDQKAVIMKMNEVLRAPKKRGKGLPVRVTA